MGFRTRHFSTVELAAIRLGEWPELPDLLHLAECISCKQQLADSLILKKMIRGGDAPVGKHLTAREIDQYHACAYEGEDTDPHAFLQVDHHLQSCDTCFAKFLYLHQQLFPSKHLVDKVVKLASDWLPKRFLGSLVIQRAYDQISMALLRAVGTHSREQADEDSLGNLLSMVEPARPSDPTSEYAVGTSEIFSSLSDPVESRYVAPAQLHDFAWTPSFSREEASIAPVRRESSSETPLGILQVENATLILRSKPDRERAMLNIHAIEALSGNPLGGVEIAELDGQGSTVASGTTDAGGEMWLELIPSCKRLQIMVGKSREPWDVSVIVKHESPRVAHARTMAEEAAARRLARETAAQQRRVRREAGIRNRQAEFEKFGALSPEMQVAWVARDEMRSIFFYETLFPTLTPGLLSRIEPEVLQLLDAKLKKVGRGPLTAARRVLQTYLAGRNTRKK